MLEVNLPGNSQQDGFLQNVRFPAYEIGEAGSEYWTQGLRSRQGMCERAWDNDV